ncbi:MAG: hypothetical protein NTZ20_05120 [Candidatus Levybacteria bacterium]|nr:hypothetical protein [Candidatus Levybacteria bacterium]
MANAAWGVDLPVDPPTRYVFSVAIQGSAEAYGRLYAVRAFRGYVENATGVVPPLKDSVDFIHDIQSFHKGHAYGTVEISMPIGTLKTSHYDPMRYRGDAFAALCGMLGCLGIMAAVTYVGEK